jgi:transcriptional regulator with XRE-family HTH domain
MERFPTTSAGIEAEAGRIIAKNRRRKSTQATARRTTAIDAAVGRVVRTRRIELGMSQTSLANACGITFQQIQKYENGANRISCSRLWQFAALLGLPVAAFFDGLGKPTVDQKRAVTATRAAHRIDDDTAKIARKIASIKDERLRRRLKTMLAALAEKPGAAK